MPFRLEDGQGNGYYAGVTTDFRLKTEAIALSAIQNSSQKGNAFILYARHTIQSSSTDEELFYFKNNSTNKNIYLHKAIFSTDATGDAKIEMFFDSNYSSGGALLTTFNTNRTSSNLSGVVAYDNSSNNLVVSDETKEFFDIRLGVQASSVFLFDLDSGIVLGPNDSFSGICSGTSGDNFRLNLFYYEEEA